jgi:DNA invertase Pin-like site-specific DNA recombinase
MGVTYSDAEISGAVLERPGLHRLMRDIESGKVNVVVPSHRAPADRSWLVGRATL